MDTIELINRLEDIYINFGYPLVFFSSFFEITPMGWSIPGGTIVALGGFFAYGKSINFFGLLVFSWLGAWLTFLIAYYLGYKTGFRLVKALRQEKNAEKAERLLKSHGGVILTTSMLANLTRFWVAYVAGTKGYSLLKFFLYSGVAALTWSSLMATVGYFAGTERENLERGLSHLGILAWVLFALALGVIYWSSRKDYEKFKEGEGREVN